MQRNSGWQDGLREGILAWIDGCKREDERGPFMAELVAMRDCVRSFTPQVRSIQVCCTKKHYYGGWKQKMCFQNAADLSVVHVYVLHGSRTSPSRAPDFRNVKIRSKWSNAKDAQYNPHQTIPAQREEGQYAFEGRGLSSIRNSSLYAGRNY
jgi:hypothetical protein